MCHVSAWYITTSNWIRVIKNQKTYRSDRGERFEQHNPNSQSKNVYQNPSSSLFIYHQHEQEGKNKELRRCSTSPRLFAVPIVDHSMHPSLLHRLPSPLHLPLPLSIFFPLFLLSCLFEDTNSDLAGQINALFCICIRFWF